MSATCWECEADLTAEGRCSGCDLEALQDAIIAFLAGKTTKNDLVEAVIRSGAKVPEGAKK